jgi:hypothetical protein
MEKRSIVHAVYAESLVFESNFGREAVPAINPDNAHIEPAKPPSGSAAVTPEAVTSENVRTNDTAALPILH